MRISASTLDVTSIVGHVVEVIPQTKNPTTLGGRAWERLRRRGGLESPQVVTGCAEMSVQPWGWRYNNRRDDTAASGACEWQPRASAGECQPDVRRIGIRIRVFSHSRTSSVALPAGGA